LQDLDSWLRESSPLIHQSHWLLFNNFDVSYLLLRQAVIMAATDLDTAYITIEMAIAVATIKATSLFSIAKSANLSTKQDKVDSVVQVVQDLVA
jgi:hypothetical protein